MLNSRLLSAIGNQYVSNQIRSFGKPPRGCGPKKPKCPTCGPVGKRRVEAPRCRPAEIPANPCVPRYYHGKDKIYKRYKYIFLFFSLPIIIIKSITALNENPPHKPDCVDYEYLRRRTKRFPWGDGTKSLFHNDHTNILPGECEEMDLEECE